MKSANNIIASVDLIDGSVVRLQQGDYGRQTRYRVDALEQLSRYIEDGSRRLHIVDLDGAKKISVIEQNYTGQLFNIIKMNYGGHDKMDTFVKYDGTPFKPVEIEDYINDIL